jgi:hypothetical protein
MDLVRAALKGQYHAGLGMLREAVESCPADVWESGVPPRQFWRLAYHALYFTNLSLEVHREEFKRWEKHRDEVESDEEHEKLDATPYSKAELIEYLEIVESRVDSQLDLFDLSSPESGNPYYKFPKLDYLLMNIRHIQEHTGQLRDRLLEAGVDQGWIGKA